jgi:hypothetical protein
LNIKQNFEFERRKQLHCIRLCPHFSTISYKIPLELDVGANKSLNGAGSRAQIKAQNRGVHKNILLCSKTALVPVANEFLIPLRA